MTQLNQSRSFGSWPALLAGILLGGVIGWVVFFGLPGRAAQPADQIPTATAAEGEADLAPVVLNELSVGSPAPDFSLDTPGGDSMRLSDQQGNVVLLNFWATWCAPCRTEMPLLQSAFEQYADDGLVILGVDFDESADEVQTFADQLSLSFPLLLDPGGVVQSLYRVPGYPTSVMIDREGTLIAYHIGGLNAQQLDAYLQQAGLLQ